MYNQIVLTSETVQLSCMHNYRFAAVSLLRNGSLLKASRILSRFAETQGSFPCSHDFPVSTWFEYRFLDSTSVKTSFKVFNPSASVSFNWCLSQDFFGYIFVYISLPPCRQYFAASFSSSLIVSHYRYLVTSSHSNF